MKEIASRLLDNFDRLSEAPDALPRLRQFILDLAVRGKLVEQDPNDEPALELLKRIQAEKARLVKEGKIKRVEEYSEATSDDGCWEIPSNWRFVRLGAIANVVMGQSPPGSTYNTHGAGVPLINGPVEFSLDPFGKTTVNQYTTSPTNYCEPGDFLLCVRGSTTGRTNIAAFRACIGRGVAAVQALFQDQFVRLYLVSRREAIIEMGRGIAFPSVSRGQITNLVVPLPPLPEQHRIVAKVGELMALCDRLEAAQNKREQRRDRLVAASLKRINQPAPSAEGEAATAFREHARFHLDHLPRLTTRPEHIKALRQSILNLAVQGKLVEQEPNDEPARELLNRISTATRQQAIISGKRAGLMPFLLPPGWEWSRVGLVTTKTGSGSTPRGGKSVYRSDGVLFLRSQNVYDDGLRLNDVAYIDEDTHKRMGGTALEPGDLLLNITGGSIGRCCRIPDSSIEANISQHVAIIRLAAAQMRDFVHKVVLSPSFQSFVIAEQTGAGRGGLPKNRMDQIPVPIPPLAEQHRIVAKVDELMAVCDQLETRLTTTQTGSRRLLEAVLHEALAPAAEKAA